ncbi:cellobiose phosphorylase [Exiguobacterium sp. SH4S7]|uniref:GH36-type glycosyl hydrolase domain-containing protein n=1 Tax=Exiguobacterium sp. SH4S7 TaxID=2510958 RepID=UPI0010397D94|nr:amylo-alpha-1,6-glucosidase [Exiguobacterium sp. SH4S7]TCI34077.1 cellobiose phosphorylase [Exiguobacterium sp. SH4S7]
MNVLTEQTTLTAGDVSLSLTPMGDIRQLKTGPIMVNQLIHHPFDGSMANLYVRYEGEVARPLLGLHSPSDFVASGQEIVWSGRYPEFAYEVRGTLSDNGVRFDATFEGTGRFDVTYVQDLGLADEGGVRTNEAYMAQYIDYVKTDAALMARQNQKQSTGFPAIRMTSSRAIAEYATDGFDVYGTSYKLTGRAAGLDGALPSRVYQYEFALPTLRTETLDMGTDREIAFELSFVQDHPEALTEQSIERFVTVEAGAPVEQPVRPRPRLRQPFQPISGAGLTMTEVERLYPVRRLEETEDGQLLSFFTEEGAHVVLAAKEHLVERSHGNILLNAGSLMPDESKLATTVFMNGVFNSHIVYGNTNFNKWTTNVRNPLNVPKTSGQRIYVEMDGAYRLLTMPSLFEMRLNEAVWRYELDGETIVVRTFIASDAPVIKTTVESSQPRRFVMSNQIAMNTQEYVAPFHMEQTDNRLVFKADEAADSAATRPDLTYAIESNQPFQLLKTSDWFDQPFEDDLVWMAYEPSERVTMHLGLATHTPFELDEKQELHAYRTWMDSYMNGLTLEGETADIEALNIQALWYVQNMRVHYQSPHGLEQYGGAAWGTRDVSQGPMEFLLSTGHFDEARKLLLVIFSHQFKDGDWPQWFMFDEYAGIQQEDSHGDVIVWPLKALSDYLSRTEDVTCLDETIPFRDRDGKAEANATLYAHVERALGFIEEHFVDGSVFSAYGGGDWDDTLQPADEDLKRHLISSWTVTLTYQAFRQLHEQLPTSALAERLGELSQIIRKQFTEEMIRDGVIAGFLKEVDGRFEAMLHPSDETLPMRYRLLPMTRSVIAELVDQDQMTRNFDLIATHLTFPDGVRLMNRPAEYRGGVSRHFMRAEQAANFGREIGLQYVHAHIRYIEALAKAGHREKIRPAFNMINPVRMDEVKNAAPRQRNAYFSSSDGDFADRYAAESQFDRLKDGTVPVKAGWRIYSSGPGIWFNQLVSNYLGIRLGTNHVELDPIVDADMHVQLRLFGADTTIQFRKGDPSVTLNGQKLTGHALSNPYREAGQRIGKDEFLRYAKEKNELVITVKG